MQPCRCCPCTPPELLFANRSYRLWFGADPAGHALLAGGHLLGTTSRRGLGDVRDDGADEVDDYSGLPAEALTETGSDPREVYVESLAMWFDVRARYLQWTDGRLAQMLIATDITMRRARRGTGGAAGRQGPSHQPADDDGRNGLQRGPRAEPAAHGHHQLLQRHGFSRVRNDSDRQG